MPREEVLLSALFLLPALLWSAEPGRCQLTKGLYEERLALLQKAGLAEPAATGALLAAGVASPATKLASIDDEYRGFFAELAAATQSNDSASLKACCDRAAN